MKDFKDHKTDIIYNNVTVYFKFWDRVKILLGKPAIVKSTIYTLHQDAKIIGSTAETTVPVLIKRKPKHGGLEIKSA